MPYIVNRKAIDAYVDVLRPHVQEAGELNYSITRLCHNFINSHDVRYATLNTVIGVLECAKLELYRQVAAPYEDKKKAENGPVSNLDDDRMENIR